MLDELRGLLPDSEIETIGALLAEMEEAASSPEALRRWERKAAREQAERAALEAACRKRGIDLDGDGWALS